MDKKTIDLLFHEALKFRSSERFKHFFSFIAKFNHYSRYNSMLVYLQDPAVTFFGSATYWKTKFNRQIRNDAKPLVILAPNGPVILAYDVMETKGQLSAQDFLEEGLKTKVFEVNGLFQPDRLAALTEFATDLGIKVTEKPLNFFNAGAVTTFITKQLNIYLKDGHAPVQHFSTLCHELAHVLLGHTGHAELTSRKTKARIRLEKRPLSNVQCELEAETVSFLVCRSVGLDTPSVEYLAGYITSDTDWGLFSYELVIKCADKIQNSLKGLRVFVP